MYNQGLNVIIAFLKHLKRMLTPSSCRSMLVLYAYPAIP